MSKVSAETLAASEKVLEDYLETQKSLDAKEEGKGEEQAEPTLKDVLAQMDEIRKSIADRGESGEGTASEGEGDGDEGQDDLDGLDDNSRRFMEKSLSDVEEEAEENDDRQTALELSRWLDGNAGVTRAIFGMMKSLSKDVHARLDAIEARQNLLVNFQAAQIRKALKAEEAPAGRAAQLSVLQPPVGAGSSEQVDLEQMPDPSEIKGLAIKAMNAGELSMAQVAQIETYVNGVPGEFGPMLPPAELLQPCLNQRKAA